MMTGYCYMDGIDIYDEFGVFIEGDGYDGFLSFPAIKEPDKNDWPEENGIEVDLSSPKLQPREFKVDFAITDGRRWRPFFVILTNPGYRSVNTLGRSWMLRVSEMPELDVYTNEADMFSVKFIENEPNITAGYQTANADIGFQCALSLDGKTMDRYGMIITEGLNDLERAPKLKKALTRAISTRNGQEYDTDFIRYAEKEVTFGCCLNANQMADFWNLYDAFFGDLLKPGLRKIGYQGKQYDSYYKNTANWKLHSHRGTVVCEFDLTLCFTSFVVGTEIFLLCTENEELIVTEDGFCIDLKY